MSCCRLVETGTSLKHSRRVDGHVYRDVVRGCDLVTWMVDNQKATTRQDAVRQARTLLENHIIRHGQWSLDIGQLDRRWKQLIL